MVSFERTSRTRRSQILADGSATAVPGARRKLDNSVCLVASVVCRTRGGMQGTCTEMRRRRGGTRQSVNAALRGFERRGWIEVHDRTITVRQRDALSGFAGI